MSTAPTEEDLRRVRAAPVFKAIPEPQLSAILAQCEPLQLRAGERLWTLGGRAERLAVVLAGKLKLTRPEGAREVIIDVAVPGDVLGEIALSSDGRYSSSAVCLRYARVLCVPIEVVRHTLEQTPRAALALAFDLAAQNLRLVRALEDLSSGSVERRLASVLLRLAERAGEPFPGGTLVALKLRRADLAAIAATTVETASRKMTAWQRKGWVVQQPAGILIRDEAALRAIADRQE